MSANTWVFYADGKGNITPTHVVTAYPGDIVTIETADGANFAGPIFAMRGGLTRTEELVGSPDLSLGTSYKIDNAAAGHTYSLTVTPSGLHDGSTGTLNVGTHPPDGGDPHGHHHHHHGHGHRH